MQKSKFMRMRNRKGVELRSATFNMAVCDAVQLFSGAISALIGTAAMSYVSRCELSLNR